MSRHRHGAGRTHTHQQSGNYKPKRGDTHRDEGPTPEYFRRFWPELQRNQTRRTR